MHTASRTLLLASIALSATGSFAGEIQQVSASTTSSSQACGEGCNDACSGAHCSPDGRCRTGRCRDAARDHRRQNRCGVRGTWNAAALNWCDRCGPVGRMAGAGCPAAQKACWCCNTKAFPDSGWAPPAHVPVTRSGGNYSSDWPGPWSGNPGGNAYPYHPMVYQPTDTTQLGYSYARVPTWQPNPGMIPPVPNPSMFHHRYCPADPQASCFPGHHGGVIYGDAMHGEVIYEGMPQADCQDCHLAGIETGSLPAIQQELAANLARNRGIRAVAANTGEGHSNKTSLAVVEAPAPNAAPVSGPPVTRKLSQKVQSASLKASQPAQGRPEKATQLISGSQTQAAAQGNTKFVQKQQTAPQQTSQHAANSQSRPSAARPTQNTRPQTKRQPAKNNSGGWFGLPSLSEMRL